MPPSTCRAAHPPATPIPHRGAAGPARPLHPDAGRVLDADAASFPPLGLTPVEAEAVATEASYLQDDHGHDYLGWVARVLNDIRDGHRDRCGRYVASGATT